MAVKVSYSGQQVDQMLCRKNMDRVNYLLANQVMADMDQFVPYKGGTLSKSAHIAANGKTIVYNTPYSKTQFYGFVTRWKTGQQSRIYNYTTTVHPQASRRWDLRAKSLYTHNWEKIVAQKLTGGN